MKHKTIIFLATIVLVLPEIASANVVFFGNDDTARDCSAIGTWNAPTQTCTMSGDVSGRIIITDPGTTLDGAGHTLSEGSSDTTLGVRVQDAGSVTVKNLHINGFSFGVYFDTSPSGMAENNTVNNEWIGISLFSSPDGTLRGNTTTGTLGFLGLVVNSSDNAQIENNTVSGYSQNIMFDGASFGTVRNNTLSGGYTGIEVRNSSDNTFTENTISGATDAAVYFSDSPTPSSFRNIFSQNTFHDSNLGVLSALATNTGGGGGPMVSFLNALFPSALAESADDNIFFHNDFINNTQDVSLASADLVRFSKLVPDGGNFWDKNIGCVDADTDGFCDAPYLVSNLGVSDDFPRVHSISVTPTTPTLINPTETEDDGNQDGKGVADKTNFTFDISYTGATAPSDVTLWTNDGTITNHYPLALSATTTRYTITHIFPKGHYSYHFEANGGAQRFPATGELGFTTGYSNVAFLPGLEASRLYQNLPVLGEAQLWTPPLIHNNSKLFLTASGTPVTNGIYTKRDGEIDEAYGFNIYKSFIDSMDGLVEGGTINAWEPLPYDWRFDIHDIVNHPIALATTTYSMTEEIQKLAESSDTGKVTIISHSNGGLVGKTLISEMESVGRANTLDKIIMVAVPQLGTPQAMVSLLHGEGLPTNFPIFLSKTDSRTLAENMPSGYSLLPSTEYLARVIDPVATFDSTDLFTASYFSKYGSVITNQTELHGFLLGVEGRTKPTANDTFTPNILNRVLLAQAESNHAILDHWIAPVGVEVTQIAGWGVPTVSGIKYTSADTCGGGCIVLDHEPVFTSDGDVTVVIPSAVAMGVNTYFVNLKSFNDHETIVVSRDHSDILEVKPVRDFITGILQNSFSLPNYISVIKPIPSLGDVPSLRLKVHSPVSLSLYDSFGEHTGLATTTAGIQIIEKQIPNSYYFEMGEGKYAGGDMVGASTIKLVGQALGTFTLDVEKLIADNVVASITFAGIPVTASTTAVLSVRDLVASSTPVLVMDINADGVTDAIITAGNGISAQELLGVLRGLIKTLHLPTKKEEKLLKEVDKLDKDLEKDDKDGKKNERNQKHRTKEAFNEIEKTIAKFQKKNLLAKDEADELISILEQIKGTVVK